MPTTKDIRLKIIRDRNVTFTEYSRAGSHKRPEAKFNGKLFSEVEAILIGDGYKIDDVEPRRVYFVKDDVTYRVDV